MRSPKHHFFLFLKIFFHFKTSYEYIFGRAIMCTLARVRFILATLGDCSLRMLILPFAPQISRPFRYVQLHNIALWFMHAIFTLNFCQTVERGEFRNVMEMHSHTGLWYIIQDCGKPTSYHTGLWLTHIIFCAHPEGDFGSVAKKKEESVDGDDNPT